MAKCMNCMIDITTEDEKYYLGENHVLKDKNKEVIGTMFLSICIKCRRQEVKKIQITKIISSLVFFLISSAIIIVLALLIFLVFKMTWGMYLLAVLLLSFWSLIKTIYKEIRYPGNPFPTYKIRDICTKRGFIPKENIINITKKYKNILQDDFVIKEFIEKYGDFEIQN